MQQAGNFDRVRIELINTGSELMAGQTLNTHLGEMSRRLAGLGLEITRQHTVPDGEVIVEVLGEAVRRADVVLVTGGLGPTEDDRTRQAVSQCLGRSLRLDAEVERTVFSFFQRRGISPPERVRVQAMVPEGATVLANAYGTAPGLWLEESGRWIFCLPGPPGELWPMVDREVLPRLRQRAGQAGRWFLESWRVEGLGESVVEEKITPLLRQRWPGLDIGLCARAGEVDIRLRFSSESEILEADEMLRGELGDDLLGRGPVTVEQAVIELARQRRCGLAVAESCTGGLIASRLTDVPGASEVLDRGWVTYSNRAKREELGVSSEVLERKGAVSEEVAELMARGALQAVEAMGPGLAIGVTGIAGPGGGTAEKPVGLVCFGMARRGSGGDVQVRSWRLVFNGNRQMIRRRASQVALDALRRALLKTKG